MRNWLKTYRKKNKLSQLDMAKKLEISQQYYAFIENGERQAELRANMLIKLAQLFDCSVDELLKMEAEGNKPNDMA